MSDIVKRLGERIRQIRKDKGISQELLGERSGLHTNYIGQVERGEKNLTIDSLAKIASGLEVTLEQLFRSIDPMPSSDDVQKLVHLLEGRPSQDKKFALQLIQSIWDWEKTR